MTYMGFDKLKGELSHEKGVDNPGAVAASIGRKKYGKAAFQHFAAAGKKLSQVHPDTRQKRRPATHSFLKGAGLQ